MALLENKTAFVTGSSKGIGRAVALKLAREGADIVINYNSDESGAHEVAHAVTALGRRALVLKGSVASAEEVRNMFATIRSEWSRLDILVNNAGITKDGFLMMMREEDWDGVINTNLKSMFLCSKEAVRIMMAHRAGNIINMTSVTGLTGQAGQTNYGASKGGIISFTKCLAREVASKNIRVNAVAPGFIETAMIEKVKGQLLEASKQSIPMGRFGTPEEVAGVAAFLASDLSSYMTGQVISVNGGQYM
jgi:3-oxoacyl-[acyl-carrier protein] reductase